MSDLPRDDIVEERVRPGSVLLTDGMPSYRTKRIGASYDDVPTSVKGAGRRAHEVLPGIHRVFALLDRVLKGTYQGAVRRKHLGGYLDEFSFRFNRRNSKSRALLFQRALSAGSDALHGPTGRSSDARTRAGSPEVTGEPSSPLTHPTLCPEWNAWLNVLSGARTPRYRRTPWP